MRKRSFVAVAFAALLAVGLFGLAGCTGSGTYQPELKSAEVAPPVIGEEGTSAEDYIVYQKGELLDAVYLQQNSFDPIDAACDPDRQIHEFNVLYDVLTRDFALSDKKEIRAFFNQVRQEFLDWHNTVFRTPEFEAQEKRLKDFYLSKAAG